MFIEINADLHKYVHVKDHRKLAVDMFRLDK